MQLINPLTTTIFALIFLLASLTVAIPTQTQSLNTLSIQKRGLSEDLAAAASALNPFAAKSTAAPAPAAPAAAVTCRCTVVFGDKSSISINTMQGSTTGLSGQQNSRKACTAQLLVGSGCSAAIASESDSDCVRSQACTIA